MISSVIIVDVIKIVLKAGGNRAYDIIKHQVWTSLANTDIIIQC